MKERVSKHIEKAKSSLVKAQAILEIELFDDAGRSAYIAAFHAALAFIAQRSDKTPKTHNGTRSVFADLARQEPVIDRMYTAFLAESYKLKTCADYLGDSDGFVTLVEAQEAIKTAERFVALIESLVQET